MALLTDKVVIVTGAAGGIGRATATVLAAHGARLVLSDVAANACDDLVAQITAGGGQAIYTRADLASEAAIAGLVEGAVAQFGRIDGAFNNAGIEQKNKPLADLTLEEWDQAIRIDLTAVFLCIKHQVRAMLATGGGAIVNTASSLGQVAIPGAAEYIAAKHGVIGLTRAAGADYAAQGIRVNAVLPGIIRTPLIARLLDEPSFAAMGEKLKSRHPIGRFGEAHEVGEAVAWLLSDAASFMSGAAMACDGGYLSI
ncbi:SDR family NAD(P)-dependent oxidoreductase [Novosphingobium sp.]|uniref:SDR family NAD(P)-dependent oxidoreductase n=1 Tax=Novosphingobium sp. TaxID=1874826 RepID=UPI003D0B8B01